MGCQFGDFGYTVAAVAKLDEPRMPDAIVGIGASAGGLTAFEEFFSALPDHQTGSLAFVIVQHLSPDHKSILGELIGRHTRMKVCEVVDGTKVIAGSTYIIPPNRDMTIAQGCLFLQEPAAPRSQRLPIDLFFRSLARDQGEQAICIVLSGSGTDGTLGLRAIKAEGGMVMAQVPDSAEYNSMPLHAIATGLVDFIGRPGEMPARLLSYVECAFLAAETSENGTQLKTLFQYLQEQTGHDFSLYKRSTISRRLQRRMAVCQVQNIGKYLALLRENSEEVLALFRDLLIGVTHFFRDPRAFQVLESEVIPKLLSGKAPRSPIRIWVPGCSTGEEAYSIAILLQEYFEKQEESCPVQIFATDIDGRAIAKARAGFYPAKIVGDISKERLSRFFVREQDGSGYRILKTIRDMLVFSEQDLVAHPPFSRLDLISCRNLLIYLSQDLQKRVMPLFHYALNSRGYLFLGPSETVGELSSYFTILDRQAKIFQKTDAPSGSWDSPRLRAGTPIPPLPASRTRSRKDTSPNADHAGSDALQVANEELQSTNEELETSKEELQSVNEELATVNAELQNKVSGLSQANNDLSNLLASTDVGTIFVDHQLLIKRFTPSVTRIIHLIPSDIGRPVWHFVTDLLDYNRLADDIRTVTETLVPKETEVRSAAGSWYLLRIRPYRTTENVVEGAVITFVDISELRRAQSALRETEGLRRLAVVVRNSTDAILVVGLDGTIMGWNPAAERLYGYSENEALQMNLKQIVPTELHAETLSMIKRLTSGIVLQPLQTFRVTKDGQRVGIWLTATALQDAHDKLFAIATTEHILDPKGACNE